MTSLLNLQFGSSHVTLFCEDTAVIQTLSHHFKYCIGAVGTAVAHYQIRQDKAAWHLQREQTLLGQAAQAEALFEPFLQDVLEQLIAPEADHLIFHAGGISLAEQGVLLCGQTAVGKSTLTAQLITSGFNYLTDEAVALPLSGLAMRGFARSLVLKSGSEFIWQTEVTTDELLILPDGFSWLTPTFLRANCVQKAAVPKLILFPQYKATVDFAVQSLSAAETAFQLMQHLVNARNLPESGLTAVAKLAQNVPAFAVQHGEGTAVVHWLQDYLTR